MQSLIYYLALPHIWFSVTIPIIFSVFWFLTEGKRAPPQSIHLWAWMVSVIGAYYFSFWEITEEYRSLHIVNAFFIYLAFRAVHDDNISPAAAYVLSFLCIFTVDVIRALEYTVQHGEHLPTFWYGIGGAGIVDGLCIFPLTSAAFVHYVQWRKRGRSAPLFTLLSKKKFPL